MARAVVLPAQAGAALQVELRPQDVSWHDFLAAVPQPASLRAHVADAYATTNILFSSGTTGELSAPRWHRVPGCGLAESPPRCGARAGEPKAIPWTHITPVRAGADAFFHQDVRAGAAPGGLPVLSARGGGRRATLWRPAPPQATSCAGPPTWAG